MTLFYFFLEEKMCPGFGVPLGKTKRNSMTNTSSEIYGTCKRSFRHGILTTTILNIAV